MSGRRLSRTTMVGATLSVLTLAGHCAAGGSLPGPAGVVIAVLLSVGLGATLSGKTLRPVPVLGLLLVGQGLAHLVLSVTAHHPGPGGGAGPVPMVAAHVTAAAGAAVLISYTDELVGRWLTFWASVLGAPRPLVVTPQRRPAPVGGYHHHVGAPVAARYHVTRRGPPVAGTGLGTRAGTAMT